MSSLLVIDYDFFFPDPMGNDESSLEALLFDWSHNEDALHLGGMLWAIRASAFLSQDIPLPTVRGLDGFWDRFDLSAAGPLLVADSNSHAGAVTGFDEVWLFDAHHDAGYRTTPKQVAERGYTCEDWMLAHHNGGAVLHSRYPRWRSNAFRVEPAPACPLERAFDDGLPVPVRFDQVFLCRSGAWVPPWCDTDFAAFAAAYPHGYQVVDDAPLVRDFDLGVAEQMASMQRSLLSGSAS